MFPTTPPPAQRLLIFTGIDGALPELSDMNGTEVEVMWEPTPKANHETLQKAFGERNLALQTGATLGDRLCMAFSERFFFQRTEKIIAIGMDDPLLDRETIDHAFSLLNSCDWVVGPAENGRCYLIGCRGAAFETAIFMDVDWRSAPLESSLQMIRGWEASLAVLPRRT